MQQITLIALAGACGTVCRYWLSGLVFEICGRDFPWGTWAVNILGCFLFGLVVVLSEERGILSPQNRIFLLTGFMGAFTTFSTLIFECSDILSNGQWLRMALNLSGQTIFGFAAIFLGAALGRLI